METKVLNLYPIDYPFETLNSRVENKKLQLNPDFQQKYKWDKENDERTSKFIESCLMRIPIPTCYFAEKEDGTHFVIDGVQRITTIVNFFNDKFSLEGLQTYSELNGKKFSQLGPYRSELESYTLRCIILRKENPIELVQEIFARLNQGSVLLTAQEIRHALYAGSLDNLLGDLAEIPIIQDFGTGEQDGLEAEQLVLRFFAMRGDLTDYQSDLTKYLDQYMRHYKDADAATIANLRQEFIDTLEKCQIVFDDKSIFTDITKLKGRKSLVYYDLLMWSFQHETKDFLMNHKVAIREKFKELCHMAEFQKLISGGTQRAVSIQKRRNLWQEKLKSIHA